MAYTITIYDEQGKKLKDTKLDEALYNKDRINTDLMHEYVVLQQSNKRVAIAHTKTRGEIRGSGKKLYRQKGTGNARAGDKKANIRKGGGVAFGPRSNRNFIKAMPKKMRRRALLGFIAAKAEAKSIKGIKLADFDVPQTRRAASILQANQADQHHTLFVTAAKDEKVAKSLSNIPTVTYKTVNYLNPLDMLRAKTIMLTPEAIDYLNNVSLER